MKTHTTPQRHLWLSLLLALPVTLAACGCGQASQYAGGQTACDHPYLPLRLGARWEYLPSAGWAEDMDGTIAEVTCAEPVCTSLARMGLPARKLSVSVLQVVGVAELRHARSVSRMF